MKKLILIIFLLFGCSRSEVIDFPITKSYNDTLYIPKEKVDTSRTPITFDVTIKDWIE